MGKRGPKRQDGAREANGRLSRKAPDVMDRINKHLGREEKDILRTGVEARVRLFGIDPRHSRDQMLGSFVGRLCLSKELTLVQYDAALAYLGDWQANSIAVQAPRQPAATNLNAVRGASGADENVDATRHAMERYRAARAAVQERQNELRGAGALFAALDHLVVDDRDFYHMVGWLREALNALVRHYKLEARAA